MLHRHGILVGNLLDGHISFGDACLSLFLLALQQGIDGGILNRIVLLYAPIISAVPHDRIELVLSNQSKLSLFGRRQVVGTGIVAYLIL